MPVLLGSALNKIGLEEVYGKISEFISLKKSTKRFDEVRKIQAEKRFDYWVKEYILSASKSSEELENQYNLHKKMLQKWHRIQALKQNYL